MRLGAIPIHIKIGEIQTMEVENWQVNPDDRQTMIETVGGVVVQDFGHIENGDKFTCTVTMTKPDSETVFDYWHNRIFVDVEDEGGKIYRNMRVKVKNYSYLKGFGKYIQANLEFWKV